MYRAYVRADSLDDPAAFNDLKSRLGNDISIILTDKPYNEIVASNPFLYFRNPYIRFDNELEIIKFHTENSNFPYLTSIDGEIISVSSFGGGLSNFIMGAKTSLFEPKIEPLPIIVGAHRRPLYLGLTLRSLLYNIQSKNQKIYIVLSDPDTQVINTVDEIIENSEIDIQVVASSNNLFYSWPNFGAKFFNLEKMILFDDDVILPGNLKYHVPYWTSQLNYRSSTADLVALRVSTDNYASGILEPRAALSRWASKPLVSIPKRNRWFYSKLDSDKEQLPIGGGMGMVIDSKKHLKNFAGPNYVSPDGHFCTHSRNICIANVTVYHIGSNEIMDFPAYSANKPNVRNIDRHQEGTNLITKEIKSIDLKLDWTEHPRV